jgi:2-methylisocitrate lyase-like PEP mutase family enzyme
VTQREKAERLLALHRAPEILVLPNAWDAATAKLFERLGAAAIATTSAPIAWSLGRPDGEAISRDEMIAVVERIARAVGVPVTADLEAGYGDAGATAEAAIAAGAVGLNLEDGNEDGDDPLVPTEVHAERIKAVREVADRDAVPLVINARTDVFLRQVGKRWDRFDRAVERANAYLDAGADCAFLVGVADAELIRRLVEAIEGPVSVLAREGSPPIAELEQLGVARVSIGPGLARTALTAAEGAGRELLEGGTYGFLDGSLASAELNRLLG